MNPYLQMFCWGNYHLIDREYLRSYLAKNKPTLIEYISQEEWAFSSFIADELIEYADKNDVEVRVLLNSYNMWNNTALRPELKNIVYEDCPTFIMNFILDSYLSENINHYNQSLGNPSIHSYEPASNFKFKIISMTNKVFWWRSKMIDHFEEYGVINPNNRIIWHNIEVGDRYDYKFFKPRVLSVDKFKDQNGNFNSFKLPSRFSRVWFSAVYETSIDIIAMSEKVFTPLLYMKPFIVLGSKGYHQFLKSLGFKLFEEFIDYSFDLEDDVNLRIEMYCKEIAKVNSFSFDQINNYNQLIREKLIHNKKQVFQVFKDQSLCPKKITHWKNIVPTGKEILEIDKNVQDYFYSSMTKRGWYNSVS